jgi:cytochrome c
MKILNPAPLITKSGLLATGVIASLVFLAQAQAQSVERGLQIARTKCARCHSIDKIGPSPMPVARPFRLLHQQYPVEALEEALGEGIATGHPDMPEVRLDPRQISDFTAFLKSLQ